MRRSRKAKRSRRKALPCRCFNWKISFVVMKTGTHPFIAKLRLYFEWGVTFDEPVYIIEEKSRQKTRYIQKDALRTKILLENSKIGSTEIGEEGKQNEKKGVSLRTS